MEASQFKDLNVVNHARNLALELDRAGEGQRRIASIMALAMTTMSQAEFLAASTGDLRQLANQLAEEDPSRGKPAQRSGHTAEAMKKIYRQGAEES
jgi:hypothetical protein